MLDRKTGLAELLAAIAATAVLAACSRDPAPLSVQTESDGDARRMFLVDANAQPLAGISCNAPGVKVLDLYFQLEEPRPDVRLSLRIGDDRFDAVNVTLQKTRLQASSSGGIVLTPELRKALPAAEKLVISADDTQRAGLLDANSRQFVAEMLRICDSAVR